MEKNKAQIRTSAQSMVNNLKSAPDTILAAGKAKFYLRRLRQMTGHSEQSLLCELVLNGVSNHPEYSRYLDQMKREYAAEKEN